MNLISVPGGRTVVVEIEPTDEELTELSMEEILFDANEDHENYLDAVLASGPPCTCTTDEVCNGCLTEVPNEPANESDFDFYLAAFYADDEQ